MYYITIILFIARVMASALAIVYVIELNWERESEEKGLFLKTLIKTINTNHYIPILTRV